MTRTEAPDRLAIATLLLVSVLAIVVSTAISPALPSIRAEFADVEHGDFLVRLLLTLPSVFIALGAPLVGVLVDRLGRKPVLLSSTVLYGLAGGVGYFLETFPSLLASRALLGVATAGVFVAATTLITDYFTGDRRDTVLGWQGAAITLGGVVALTLGGVLAGFDWRTPFLLYVAALLLVPLAAIGLHEPEVRTERIDRSTGSTSVRDERGRFPLRTLALVYGIGLLGNLVFFVVPVEIPFYLEALSDPGETLVGVAVAASALFSGIAASQYGRLRRRLEIRSLVALLFGLFGVGFGIVGASGTYPGVVVGLAVTGLGFGLLQPTMSAWIAAAISEERRGRAFGGLTSAFFLGQFLSPFASTPLTERIGLDATFGVGAVVVIAFGCLFVALIGDVSKRDGGRPAFANN